MVIEKTKNAVRNVWVGLINRIANLILPFLLRTVMIYTLGEQYLGLNSLFSSILSVLSLAELGFGGAVTYSMYKPIADNDQEKIRALLNLYKRIYNIIGMVILGLGIIILPFLPYLTKGECPTDINLYGLYVIYLFNTVVTYFFGGYRSSVLIAHQRRDVTDSVNFLMYVLFYTIQIVLLLITKSFLVYVVIIPLMSIFSNIGNAYMAKKIFPQYSPIGEISKEEKNSIYKNVFALFLQKIGTTISSSLDSIIISSFLGLSVVARYSNYNYICASVGSIMTIIYNSILAGIGNSLQVNSKKKNISLFYMLTFLNNWGVTWCTICMLCIYQPFIKVWAGEKYLLDFSSVICFCIYFYILMSRKIVLTYKDAAGIWAEDKYRPIVAAIFNLIVNIALVSTIGLNGVILSTILSYLLIEIPWETVVLFKKYFKISIKEYVIKYISSVIIALIMGSITYSLCRNIGDGISGIFLRGIVCIIVPNILYILLWHTTKEFQYFKSTVCDYLRKSRDER